MKEYTIGSIEKAITISEKGYMNEAMIQREKEILARKEKNMKKDIRNNKRF